jgi:hypothetical protein
MLMAWYDSCCKKIQDGVGMATGFVLGDKSEMAESEI